VAGGIAQFLLGVRKVLLGLDGRGPWRPRRRHPDLESLAALGDALQAFGEPRVDLGLAHRRLDPRLRALAEIDRAFGVGGVELERQEAQHAEEEEQPERRDVAHPAPGDVLQRQVAGPEVQRRQRAEQAVVDAEDGVEEVAEDAGEAADQPLARLAAGEAELAPGGRTAVGAGLARLGDRRRRRSRRRRGCGRCQGLVHRATSMPASRIQPMVSSSRRSSGVMR
jgi:hypothetical protein